VTVVRCAAGLAGIVSAMLVQATLVGPLVYPVPISLPLLVVVGVALVAGPSTGIALGFGAGLLADLNSHHPVGLLALTWLGAGVVAGIAGGLVVAPWLPPPLHRSRRRAHESRRRSRRTSATHHHDPDAPEAGEFSGGAPRPDRPWRAQAMATGLITAVATGVGLILVAVVGSAAAPLPGALLQLIPAVLVDAILAAPVLVVIRAMLNSAALRPVVPTRVGPNPMSANAVPSNAMNPRSAPVEFG
jgi:hypothetical protein